MFDIEIKYKKNSLPSSKDLFRCNILNIFFKNKFGRLAVYAKEEFLFKRSSWNLEMHWTMESISFLIVEYGFWGPSQMPEWNLTNCSCDECVNLCFSMPPYPISDASISTIMNAWGWGMHRQGNEWTFSLTCLTIWVCLFDHAGGFFWSLWNSGAQVIRILGIKSDT